MIAFFWTTLHTWHVPQSGHLYTYLSAVGIFIRRQNTGHAQQPPARWNADRNASHWDDRRDRRPTGDSTSGWNTRDDDGDQPHVVAYAFRLRTIYRPWCDSNAVINPESVITSLAVRWGNIAISVSVCLFVCLSVRSHISKNRTSEFHQIFCSCYLWPWLSPHVVAMQCVMYFWFCGWRRFHIMERMGQNKKWRVCFVEFARWCHRRRSLPWRLQACF